MGSPVDQCSTPDDRNLFSFFCFICVSCEINTLKWMNSSSNPRPTIFWTLQQHKLRSEHHQLKKYHVTLNTALNLNDSFMTSCMNRKCKIWLMSGSGLPQFCLKFWSKSPQFCLEMMQTNVTKESCIYFY